MKKIWITRLLCVVILLSLLTGCQNQEPEKVPEPTPTPTEEVGLEPVYGQDLENGTYTIEVTSSSSMFRIVKAVLTVDDGEMTAELTLSGQGYGYLYMGTGEDAQQADGETYIPYVEGADGAYTYTVPVEALNTEIDCAAWSIRKESWYDRTLVFLAETLKPNTEGSDAVVPEDGTYTVELTMEGGSGKAYILSPAAVTVENGVMNVTLEWSSPNYDYMLVDGEKYLPINEEGNSVFVVPIASLDQALIMIGDTVAMSTPHEVEYTVTFHSENLQQTA